MIQQLVPRVLSLIRALDHGNEAIPFARISRHAIFLSLLTLRYSSLEMLKRRTEKVNFKHSTERKITDYLIYSQHSHFFCNFRPDVCTKTLPALPPPPGS